MSRFFNFGKHCADFLQHPRNRLIQSTTLHKTSDHLGITCVSWLQGSLATEDFSTWHSDELEGRDEPAPLQGGGLWIDGHVDSTSSFTMAVPLFPMRYSGCQSVEHDEAKHPYKVAWRGMQKKNKVKVLNPNKKKKRTCQILCNLGLPSTLFIPNFTFTRFNKLRTFQFCAKQLSGHSCVFFVCFLSLRMTFLKKPWKKRLQEGDRNIPAKDPG